ncbi:MAG: Spy/CpxP family protein refolding chaperone [Pseudomonadota bacterium]|nr:Spy/CpxP family protein refolding chaperone [Pseudomonadota bacterium]
MRKELTTIFMVLVILALATTSFAYGWGQGPHGGRGPGYGPCQSGDIRGLAGIDLTAEQEGKIRSLREAHLREIKPLQDQLFSKRGELKLLWLQQQPSEEKITAVRKEIRRLRDRLQDRQTSYRLSVLKVLTPEQRTKVQTYGAMKGFGPGKGFTRGGGCGGYDVGPRGGR